MLSLSASGLQEFLLVQNQAPVPVSWQTANRWEQVWAQGWSFASSMAIHISQRSRKLHLEFATREPGKSGVEPLRTLALVLGFVLLKENKGSEGRKGVLLFYNIGPSSSALSGEKGRFMAHNIWTAALILAFNEKNQWKITIFSQVSMPNDLHNWKNKTELTPPHQIIHTGLYAAFKKML